MRIKSIISSLLSITLANAKLVMVIRHGEKIDDDHTDLSPRGQARAECLLNVFGNNGTFTTPQKIYAQSPTIQRQSTRPRDTVAPLAESLGLQIDLSYTSGKVKKLSKYIMTSPEEVILVSWGNDKIPFIAQEFGITNVPEWTKHNFEDIWILSDGTTPYLKQGNSVNTAATTNTGNTNIANTSYANTANTGNVGNAGNADIGYTNNNVGSAAGNVNAGNVNASNTGNAGFVKRGAFTLQIEKENVEQCINEKLQVQTQSQQQNQVPSNNGNSENLNSGSVQLNASVLMSLFSILFYAFVYYY